MQVKFAEVQKLLSEWNKLLTWENVDLPWKQDDELRSLDLEGMFLLNSLRSSFS
jgi:hypothetical protein